MESSDACSDASVACFGGGFRRKRGPGIDRLRLRVCDFLRAPPTNRPISGWRENLRFPARSCYWRENLPLLTSWPVPDFRITPCRQHSAATPADRFRFHANPVTPNAARKGAAGPEGGGKLGGRARKYLGPASGRALSDFPSLLPSADHFWRHANPVTPNTARQGVAGWAGGPKHFRARPPSLLPPSGPLTPRRACYPLPPTPCRPLLAPREPFNAKHGAAGGSRAGRG